MRGIRHPTLILGPGAWLAYMFGYGLVSLLRWLLVTIYRGARQLVVLGNQRGDQVKAPTESLARAVPTT